MSSLLQLEPGRTFARDYKVVRPLDEGGMGAVYIVEQISTGTQRALKLMHPDLVGDPRSRARFEQEAKVGAKIESDHVVQVLAAGVDDETALPWLVMELLKGETLARAIERRGFLPGQEILEIFRQAGHALALAHQHGLVHRDLKPENIFLATPRRVGVPFTVKILDFGIAKVLEESQRAGGAGANGTQMLGSPMYMAPEQAQAGRIGPQTDVWAMGLVAFHAWTGRVYWKAVNSTDANVQSLLAELLIGQIDPASTRANELGVPGRLPQGFDAWFSRAVAREPEARFRDAGEMVAALEASVRASVGGTPEPNTGPGALWSPATPTPMPATNAPLAVAGRTGEVAPAPAAQPPWGPSTNAQPLAPPPPFGAMPPTGGVQAPFSPMTPPPNAAPFGAPPNAPLGPPPSAMPFGAPPTSAPFGAPPTSAPFGAPPTSAPFGAPGYSAPGYAPVAAPAPRGSGTGLMVVGGLVGVMILGGVGFAVAQFVGGHGESHTTATPPGGSQVALPQNPVMPVPPPQPMPMGNDGKTRQGVAGNTVAVADPGLPSDPSVTHVMHVPSSVGGGPIVDNGVAGANAIVDQACTVGWIAVDLAGRHTYPSDLTVAIRSPGGHVEMLQTHANQSPFRRFLAPQFSGESAMGTWSVKIEDTVPGDSGTLDGFGLNVGCR